MFDVDDPEFDDPDTSMMALSNQQGSYPYSIVVDNTGEHTCLGLHVAMKFGRVIVARVQESGLVEHWNIVHADSRQEVQIGDEVMAVNGELDHKNFVRQLNRQEIVGVDLQKPCLQTVRLNNVESDLGMIVSRQFITHIVVDGLFHQYLMANPSVAVSEGDFLLDVNGINQWYTMRAELASAKSLTITVAHYESEMFNLD